jgi:hypothetical protein
MVARGPCNELRPHRDNVATATLRQLAPQRTQSLTAQIERHLSWHRVLPLREDHRPVGATTSAPIPRDQRIDEIEHRAQRIRR